MIRRDAEGYVACSLEVGNVGRCVHSSCVARASDAPERLLVNAEIRYHILTNWGRFQRETARGSKERKFLAEVVRDIRRTGKVGLGHMLAPVYFGALAK